MNIKIRDFVSLREVDLTLENGVTVLAGKNGSGKTQLFLAILSKCQNAQNTLHQAGFAGFSHKGVAVAPVPKLPLWVPSIRHIGDAHREQPYVAPVNPHDAGMDPTNLQGYIFTVTPRFEQLHGRLVSMFISGDLNSGKQEFKDRWVQMKDSFYRVFNKTLSGVYTESHTANIGIRLTEDTLSRFGTLSTGELEFLSLMYDILWHPPADLLLIDELDAHFHPELQRQIIDVISPFCKDRVVLISTQSPSVMLSVPPERLFYLRHKSEVPVGSNQITRLSDDPTLIDALTEMYVGFGRDIRLINYFKRTGAYELLTYSHQCLTLPTVKGLEKGRDSDPQVSLLRHAILHLPPNPTIIDYGAGRGRLLQAFTHLSQEQRSAITYIAVDKTDTLLTEIGDLYKHLDLQFKSFISQQETVILPPANLVLLANVFHEIGPINLATHLTRILKAVVPSGRVIIMEAMELDVGEDGFVLFGNAAIDALLRNLNSTACITTSFATPSSHSGLPILEYVITVNTPNQCDVTIDDVLRACEEVGRGAADVLAAHFSNTTILGAIKLAFYSHNLANAMANCHLLRNPPNRQTAQAANGLVV